MTGPIDDPSGYVPRLVRTRKGSGEHTPRYDFVPVSHMQWDPEAAHRFERSNRSKREIKKLLKAARKYKTAGTPQPEKKPTIAAPTDIDWLFHENRSKPPLNARDFERLMKDLNLNDAQASSRAWTFIELLDALDLPLSQEWLDALAKAIRTPGQASELRVRTIEIVRRQFDPTKDGWKESEIDLGEQHVSGFHCSLPLRPLVKNPKKSTAEIKWEDNPALQRVIALYGDDTPSMHHKSIGPGSDADEPDEEAEIEVPLDAMLRAHHSRAADESETDGLDGASEPSGLDARDLDTKQKPRSVLRTLNHKHPEVELFERTGTPKVDQWSAVPIRSNTVPPQEGRVVHGGVSKMEIAARNAADPPDGMAPTERVRACARSAARSCGFDLPFNTRSSGGPKSGVKKKRGSHSAAAVPMPECICAACAAFENEARRRYRYIPDEPSNRLATAGQLESFRISDTPVSDCMEASSGRSLVLRSAPGIRCTPDEAIYFPIRRINGGGNRIHSAPRFRSERKWSDQGTWTHYRCDALGGADPKRTTDAGATASRGSAIIIDVQESFDIYDSKTQRVRVMPVVVVPRGLCEMDDNGKHALSMRRLLEIPAFARLLRIWFVEEQMHHAPRKRGQPSAWRRILDRGYLTAEDYRKRLGISEIPLEAPPLNSSLSEALEAIRRILGSEKILDDPAVRFWGQHLSEKQRTTVKLSIPYDDAEKPFPVLYPATRFLACWCSCSLLRHRVRCRADFIYPRTHEAQADLVRAWPLETIAAFVNSRPGWSAFHLPELRHLIRE